MADLETTQSKLRSTPTAGVSGEHSAYYRRLLSAGYKGYIQGSIGGGTLYGALGVGLGAAVGIPLMFTPLGPAALILIPAIGGISGLYGAHTFADIGKTAAIIADSADTNEKRRYLLDRYYETPSDEEAKEIKRQLEEDHAPKAPETPFHWRPAIIGGIIGVTLAGIAIAMMMHGVPFEFLHAPLEFIAHGVGITLPTVAGGAATGVTAGAMSALIGASTAIGALAGSVIGIDREYIRRWLDKAEFVVHEPNRTERELAEREQQIQRLVAAANRDNTISDEAATAPVEKIHIEKPQRPKPDLLDRRPDPISPQMIAGLPEKPTNEVQEVAEAKRLDNRHFQTVI